MAEIPWALDILKGLGVGGGPVFAVLWWLERKERLAAQAENKELLPRVLTVASQAATGMTEVHRAVAVLGEAQKDAFMSPAQLGQLIRSLGAQFRKGA